ncbi:MAG: bifunctional UDP-N-acetylglucosamine diphosphorylase/glucosamine-1-phosphate N-acetyltransferase GlmU [Solirubrobacterales bacterium]|nr:bifunctional UDP-N-acetylglucosamine diphosphorylase/glucosamine-1-phosphate N-acetyltransferase GlmU [Solirubrobacterales bacterium]
MSAPVVVILAAGKGTRMRSSVPKLLHPICGRPMIGWPVAVARASGAAKIVVVDAPERPLKQHLDDDIVSVVQAQPLGTGDAVKAALNEIQPEQTVVVLTGDTPLIRAESIAELVKTHDESGAAATILTAILDEPGAYGRVVRDQSGHVTKVVEAKAAGDATPEELRIQEVNSGIFAFSGARLKDALARVQNDNAQGEYYLPDVLPILKSDGHKVAAHALQDPVEMAGINHRVQLAEVTRHAQQRINHQHMLNGVTLINPDATVIDADVELGHDVTIEQGCTLRGATTVAAGASIGPHATLIDAEVGEGSTVIHSYVNLAVIDKNVSVGPFVYLRPKAHLHDGSKAGTFVEIKNSEVGPGAKVPHLSYIGDTDIGARTNIGAGTITANYDGVNKHRTTIGADVKSSVHVSFVAPVSVGDNGWTAAGSVITDDVPAGALGVARARQSNIEGYAERRKAPKEQA